MLYSIFNTNLVTNENLKFHYTERCFLYGDGFFETIIVKNTNIKLWELHKQRIEKASSIFQFDIKLENLKKLISQLLIANSLADARIKIIFWRKEGGLYSPSTNDYNFIISSTILEENNISNIVADLASVSYKSQSIISAFKTLSSVPYVLAGIEAQKRILDELILYNDKGMVSETISSSIYYVLNDKIYTPSLQTGCIAGIIREKLLNMGIVAVMDITKDELIKVESLFTTNVAGVKCIRKIGDKVFEINETALNSIKKAYL